jgi:hypothetical protein
MSFTTAFRKEAQKTENKVVNENGALLNESTLDARVDLFNKSVRSISEDNLKMYLEKVFNEAEKQKDPEYLADLFVMMFHKRNVRGGEGEKLISYQMFLNIYEKYPQTICALVPMFANFGYFKDYMLIMELICKNQMTNEQKFKFYNNLVESMCMKIVEQRQNDLKNLEDGKTNKLSLIGKWIPREGSHFDKTCFWFYKDSNSQIKYASLVKYLTSLITKKPITRLTTHDLKNYRSGNSKLTEALKVPEVLMCANQYHLIEFEKVASKSMKNYTKAYLNEKLKGKLSHDEETTGNRYPDREDRVQARQKLRNLLTSEKVDKIKGARLEPYEIIRAVVSSNSKDEKAIYFQQWESKKKDVLEQANQIFEENRLLAEKNGTLETFMKTKKTGMGNFVPIMDVSGSMMCNIGRNTKAQAIDASISLGIMSSELASDPFKNMAISFSETPSVFYFKDDETIEDKRNRVVNNHMGYSTNFEKAVECLLDICIKHKVPEEDVPNLIVFTDGQFNSMNTQSKIPWNTSHQNLLVKWSKSGYNRVPTIIYWNLAANTPGVQTEATLSGVQLLQGFSPSLLKMVLYGEAFAQNTQVEVETEDGVVLMNTSSVSPYETFRGVIDQGCYDQVRVVLENVGEKLFANYHAEKFEEV